MDTVEMSWREMLAKRQWQAQVRRRYNKLIGRKMDEVREGLPTFVCRAIDGTIVNVVCVFHRDAPPDDLNHDAWDDECLVCGVARGDS